MMNHIIHQYYNQLFVSFCLSVVDRILQKLPLLLEGKQIHVERYTSDSEEESEEDEVSKNETDEEQECTCTVEVRGMKETTTSDTLEFYFESKRAAGVRLDILKFDFTEDDRVARIQYASEEGISMSTINDTFDLHDLKAFIVNVI